MPLGELRYLQLPVCSLAHRSYLIAVAVSPSLRIASPPSLPATSGHATARRGALSSFERKRRRSFWCPVGETRRSPTFGRCARARRSYSGGSAELANLGQPLGHCLVASWARLAQLTRANVLTGLVPEADQWPPHYKLFN